MFVIKSNLIPGPGEKAQQVFWGGAREWVWTPVMAKQYHSESGAHRALKINKQRCKENHGRSTVFWVMFDIADVVELDDSVTGELK